MKRNGIRLGVIPRPKAGGDLQEMPGRRFQRLGMTDSRANRMLLP